MNKARHGLPLARSRVQMRMRIVDLRYPRPHALIKYLHARSEATYIGPKVVMVAEIPD